MADAPDIAVGDVLGSTVFNLMLLFVLDVANRGSSIYVSGSRSHMLSAAFGVVLLSFVLPSMLAERQLRAVPLAHMSLFVPLVLLRIRLPRA